MSEQEMRLRGITGTRAGYYEAARKQQQRQERRRRLLQPIQNLITFIRKTLPL